MQLKLLALFAKLAYKHGNKIIHATDNDMLVADLGKSLKEQQAIMSNDRVHSAFIAYDLLSQLVEVKALTVAVGAKLGIPVRGRKDIEILEEIVSTYDNIGKQKYTTDIRDNLEWTRKLYAAPEIQEVLNMEMTDIEKPKSLKGITTFFTQLAGRSKDEVVRLKTFLDRTKNFDFNADEDKKPGGPKI